MPRTIALIWLILTQVVAGLLLLPWFALFAFGSMVGFPSAVLEQGGFDFNAFLFTGLLCYPILALALVVVAWVLFAMRKNDGAALVTSFAPLYFITITILWWTSLPAV